MRTSEDKIVAQLSEILALKCGMHSAVASRLRTASALHDIGKLKIPDSIINKPGTLTAQEFEIMKTHTTHGAAILASIQGDLGIMAQTICEFHHEWYDGSKSYFGKYACDLPPYVPIVSIVDVFTALLAERAYKGAWLPEEATEYIHNQAGKQFNPALVEVFISLVRHDDCVKALYATINEERKERI